MEVDIRSQLGNLNCDLQFQGSSPFVDANAIDIEGKMTSMLEGNDEIDGEGGGRLMGWEGISTLEGSDVHRRMGEDERLRGVREEREN